jgi:hypothetical protein
MPATYDPIATQTLANSTTATVSFTSIPGTYTDLVLVTVSAITSGVGDTRLNYNSDTGTNYSRTYISGDGSTATSGRQTSRTFQDIDFNGYLSTTLGQNVTIINIMNYSNSTTNKTTIARPNRAASGTDASVGLWRNTAAITRIDVTNSGSGSAYFLTGSTFTLYGIKAA